ncbi:hypothetical protein [Microbacterium sp. zg.Y909]|uniref:hypothetical protein n=1 Tax=Microbacterium sp. zg.Y909 TaxID=2969413 RepID=UPI00214B5102|nr:hypothetical protein [Microbacterium sp. zg.Y909]MCR2828029.1 hypothetical protein [Microbacterium sp. zg.Y909]
MTHPTTAASVPFDTRPLTQRVDRAAVRAFSKELRASGRTQNEVTASIVGFGVVLVFLAGMMLIGAVTSRSSFLVELSEMAPFFVVLSVAALFGVVVTFFSQMRAATRRYRLDRFARANGMSYTPQRANPSLPGMIFNTGSRRQSFDLVRGDEPRAVEFANYVYTTGSGKHRSTHRWGYVAVKLDTPLPHIVLDATGNNSLFGSNLPTLYTKQQRLSLEGDFDRHFALYCPEGYERDALYLFTPDVMARFIDNAAELDVEIVDDWLLMYTKRNASTTDPATWEWLFGAVAAVLDKLDQWERWRDERMLQAASGDGHAAFSAATGSRTAGSLPFTPPAGLLRPPPGVAPEGRRLTTRFPWLLTGLCVVAVAVPWLLDLFSAG